MSKAKTIKIFDTTLRDGEQSPGASMNIEEKMRIAHQLEKLNVDVIEAGFPIASIGDFEAVKKVAQTIKGPQIAVITSYSIHYTKLYEVGVAIATSGPGATNTVTGIATAYMPRELVYAAGGLAVGLWGGGMSVEIVQA